MDHIDWTQGARLRVRRRFETEGGLKFSLGEVVVVDRRAGMFMDVHKEVDPTQHAKAVATFYFGEAK